MAILRINPLGRLYETRKDGNAVTRFGYDGQDLIAGVADERAQRGQYDAAGNILRRYVHGPSVDDPILWYESAGRGDKRYMHKDERGSVVALTKGAGSVLGINSYDEYGVPTQTNLGRFQYTGQTWLELGMYYYKTQRLAAAHDAILTFLGSFRPLSNNRSH